MGFITVLPSYTLTEWLPGAASIFTAEIFTINALKKLSLADIKFFSHSQSELQALKSNAHKSAMVTEIPYFSKKKYMPVYDWVPGHLGVKGN